MVNWQWKQTNTDGTKYCCFLFLIRDATSRNLEAIPNFTNQQLEKTFILFWTFCFLNFFQKLDIQFYRAPSTLSSTIRHNTLNRPRQLCYTFYKIYQSQSSCLAKLIGAQKILAAQREDQFLRYWHNECLCLPAVTKKIANSVKSMVAAYRMTIFLWLYDDISVNSHRTFH